MLHFGPMWDIKDEERMEKLFYWDEFWNELNANFVLLYFSTYGSIKMWHLYLKNVEENNKADHLRLVLTFLSVYSKLS